VWAAVAVLMLKYNKRSAIRLLPLCGSGSRRERNGDSKMPKMKTKSSCKKRFSFTASGKVKAGQAGKRHGMIKRSNKFIRDQRGTTILTDSDAKVIKGFMPNR
jgi:large subunit ribosomal protein L35